MSGCTALPIHLFLSMRLGIPLVFLKVRGSGMHRLSPHPGYTPPSSHGRYGSRKTDFVDSRSPNLPSG